MCTDFLVAPPEVEGEGKPDLGPNDPVVAGRTFDYARDEFDISYHAKDHEENHPSYEEKWTNKYNFLTIRSLTMIRQLHPNRPPPPPGDMDAPFPVEGMNDQGFSVGALWFAGFAYYKDKTQKDDKKNVNWRHYYTFLEYLLGNYRDVSSVLSDVKSGKLDIWTDFEYAHWICPLHWTLHDSEGRSGLLEFTKTANNAILNHTRVCTNSPEYDWHHYNLGSYANLSVESAPIKVGHEYIPKDLSFGVRGIPGDPFPASRFVRTFYCLRFAMEHCPPKNAPEGMRLAFHLLEGVSVTKGTVAVDALKEVFGPVLGKDLPDHIYAFTAWYVAKDLRNLIFTYQTYDSFGFRSIHLKDIKWDEVHHTTADLENVPLA